MSTTRHVINRQRRLAAAATRRPAVPPPRPVPSAAPPVARPARPSRARPVVAALAALTVCLGAFAGWAAGHAGTLRDTSATRNSALTDAPRTSEVKGAITQAVNTLFSYDYAATAKTTDAARQLLTGKAVQQYATLFTAVRAQAPARKLVLTTTVTDAGVTRLTGDRAQLLVFVDQRNTSAAAASSTDQTASSPAMFTVDAVRQDGRWKISGIDTFG
ncbi:MULTISPECIES: hypothetical protein [Streptomycetaceae]|uniref:Mce-associated membrane protein n=1 Tax=Streptantibioticus cattleyicolor (strain ATCC 35852 / DSM 46488 / JCM 4925 / NBRC 14057 / NRRL 8057) TaxID=1003195 RepID=F8JUH8_STREN|nr:MULTISPECIES: hypothetical protein [Streptomycetaceae]AEW95600.1 hypothetical protein SCATT_32290 [Streptantibioticus cattleyicolor NRRL 8057 = DSM 46488]MYS60150.1 hypothetical protein [Streptomyces sp. SID5468]CCB75937.1 conserved exported protein of unknown function [Streptantibioticus cattleyicolor NRRL 8057 = DSM 46488]